MQYKCPTCGSSGFGKSIIEGRCQFCDGTENGNGLAMKKVGYIVSYKELPNLTTFMQAEPHSDFHAALDVRAVYAIVEPA